MREIISNLQPVDVAKVLGISREEFIQLPQGKKIELLQFVYSGQIFQEQDNELDSLS